MGGIKSAKITTRSLVLLNFFSKRMEYSNLNATWVKGFMVELSSGSNYGLFPISLLFQWLKWWESNFNMILMFERCVEWGIQNVGASRL